MQHWVCSAAPASQRVCRKLSASTIDGTAAPTTKSKSAARVGQIETTMQDMDFKGNRICS